MLYMTAAQSSNANMLPNEIVDHILSFVDITTLFEVCKVNRRFGDIARHRLIQQHVLHATIRLWIEQPGMVMHQPIDFSWSFYDAAQDKLVFSSAARQDFVFSDTDMVTPQIDGCTVLLRGSTRTSRRIHSISYRHNAIRVPLSASQTNYTPDCDLQTANGCAWQLNYQVKNKTTIVPVSFECSLNLVNPSILAAPSPVTDPLADALPQLSLEQEKYKSIVLLGASHCR